jgi:hypothetical protein
MALSPRKIRSYAAILVSGGLTAALVVWPRTLGADHPPASLLAGGPAKAALLTAALALATAATAFLLPMVAGRRRLAGGVFFLTVGLAVFSVAGTGGLSGRLNLTGTMLLARAAELLLLGGILLGAVFIWRWSGRRCWPAVLGHAAPAEEPALLPTRADLHRTGAVSLVLVAGLGTVLSMQFVPCDGRGQAAFGTWAAFLLATAGVHSFLPARETLWLAAPPLAAGVVGYVAAGVVFGAGPVPPDTGALMAMVNPADCAGPAVAGCMMGFEISEYFRHWLERRRKPAPAAKPARSTARLRPRRKRR